MAHAFASLSLAFLVSACGEGGGGGGGGGDCAGGQTSCSGTCVDLQTDAANCGACGEACAQGASCVDGACATDSCAPGLFVCDDDLCHDMGVDPFNCGVCGNECGKNELCIAGLCEVRCPLEENDCDGSCVDLQSDPTHCGDCTTACAGGDVCNAGECAGSCDAGLTECDGACVDTATDRTHCGACDSPCSDVESCVAGTCEVPTTGCSPDASNLEAFGDRMVGCAGMIRWEERAVLCGEGWHVCSAREWVDQHGDAAPGYNYWVTDPLLYGGTSDACFVSEREGGSCQDAYYGASGGPMHVCVDRGDDPIGNTCNWENCGYGSAPPPNEHFGGCSGDWTAGSLCCS